MPRPDEQVAATALFIVPEWVALDGRCATCGYAMARKGRTAFRCDRRNVSISLDTSCESYAPAPSLVAARKRARAGRPTCLEAGPSGD
jgi:hypothetical protein